MSQVNPNGSPPRKPPGRAQTTQNTTTNQLRELIEGHCRRMLYRGGIAEDVSDQVATILGIPIALTESVCNEYFRVLLTENTRYRNGLLNTLSHVQAVRSDLREEAA